MVLLLVFGVGYLICMVLDVWGIDVCRWKWDIFEGVVYCFYVSLYKVELWFCRFVCNLFFKDDWRCVLLDELVEGRL